MVHSSSRSGRKDNFTELVRNPDYWDASIPKIDTLRILPRPDAAALLNGFLADETEVLFNYRFTDKAAIEGANGVTQQVSLFGFLYAVMETNTPPFDNKMFRQAMAKGIDRKALAEAAQGPGPQPPTSSSRSSSPCIPARIPGSAMSMARGH